MRDENALYWVWLAEKFGVASKCFPSFVEKYPDPYDVYRLTEEELEYTDGMTDALKARLADKSLDGAYSILKYCREHKVGIIGYGSAQYPQRLRTIENPPVVLYCLGKLPNMNDGLCLGIVGTRKMSEYGKQTAYKISYELAAANAVVVSGMALGIDGVSACGAISAGGKTVAVLGSGIAKVYPRQHEKLMKIIAQHGAVITEYPPFEAPNGRNFPVRNRIISGLCQGVIVIEGARGSGSLITASKALSQGRELFALPGKVNESNSDGPNELIRNGANVVLSAEDIMGHYDFLYHDVINYGKFYKAKRKSDLDESALEKMGVCSSCYRKQIAIVADEGGNTQAPSTPSVEQTVTAEPEKTAELDSGVYESLDKLSKQIFDSLPKDKSFTPDEVSTASGIGISEVITSLTMLEISGLVTSVPGGMFKRA